MPFSRSQESVTRPKRSQTNSPFRRSILENEADDSSAAEDANSKHNTLVNQTGIDYGQVELSIQYVDAKLVVKVIGAVNLINTDKDSLSDAYARLILLPDRKKKSKRKTKIVKDSLEPKWDERFEFEMELSEACTKTIDLVVKNDRPLFSRETTFMGQCLVSLDMIESIQLGHTGWYKLMPKNFYEGQVKKLTE